MAAPQAVTATQIAEAMGVARSTVLRRAAAEAWPFEEAVGQGGQRRLYSVQALPASIRAQLLWVERPADAATPEARAASQAGAAQAARELLRGSLEARAAETRRQSALRQAGELGAAEQARIDAKLAVIRAYEALAAAHPSLPATQARVLFVAQYNAGHTPVEPAVRSVVPRVSEASLARWQRVVRADGITALAGAYGNRAGAGRLDSQAELREFATAMLVQFPHARAVQVMRGLRARFGERAQAGALELPSMRALERWVGAWRKANAEVLLALGNPDAWKNKHLVAFGSRSEVAQAINELWELDSSPADVLCTDGRHCLIGGIDVATRRARLLVAPTSKAVAVAALLRAMLLAFGVPEAAKTDNGADYTSAHVVRVLGALDVDHQLCEPFQPQGKPHIERFFGTFTRSLVELLPGYIGHSVAERQAIESRKSFAERLMTKGELVEVRMSGAELQAFCDQWLETIYHREPHAGLGDRCPLEVAGAQAAQVRWIGDERALDVLLAEAPGGRGGRRTVQKKGIHLDSGWYVAPELEAVVGHEVQVRYDPLHHDLGTVLVFGGPDLNTYLCHAQHPERTGIDRREVALKAKAMQQQRVQAERRALRLAAKRVGVDDVAREILADRAQAAGKLAVLPVRRTAANTHTSAGLEAAAAAVRATVTPERRAGDIEHLAAVREAQRRIEAASAPAPAAPASVSSPVFESLAARVQWLLRQQHERALGLEEQSVLAQYRAAQPASYRRMAAQAEESAAVAKAAAKENAPGALAARPGAD